MNALRTERLKPNPETGNICGKHRDALLLALILALTAIKGVLWSAAVPLWQGPDEDRHFSTVQFIAEHGRLPGKGEIYHDDENVIASELAEVSRLWYNPELRQTFGPGDEGPNEAAIADLDPRLRTSTERGKPTVALHIPPLYHLAGVLFYLPVKEGSLLARVFLVRQLSVLLGVGTVWCAFAITRQVFPERRLMWFTVPILVSFQPMFTFLHAVVNTDALLLGVFCLLIYLAICALKTRLSLGLALGIGLLVGAGLLTKPFILAAVVPIGAVISWEFVRGRGGRTRTGLAVGAMVFSVIIVWSPWVIRSVRLGNNPLYVSDSSVGQITLQHPFYDYRLAQYLVDYARSLLGGIWVTFWGDFGWLETPLDTPYYVALYAACGLAAVGLGLYVRRAFHHRTRDPQIGLLGFLALCVASVVGTMGAMNYYSWRTRGVAGGIQGRYYLNAIVPLAILLAIGLIHLLPERWRPAGHWLLCWGMIVLNAIALFQTILPRYYL